jgi:aspartate/glutamate racemase
MKSVTLSHISTIPGMTPEESILYYARVLQSIRADQEQSETFQVSL